MLARRDGPGNERGAADCSVGMTGNGEQSPQLAAGLLKLSGNVKNNHLM